MKQLSSSNRVMEAANHSKNSAMEAENHVKHRAMGAETISKKGRSSISPISRYLALLAFVFISSLAFAQSNLQDVVYLKNGSVIRGVIIEQVPNQSIKLQTADRNVFVYRMDEIERLTREPRLGQSGNMSSVEKAKSPVLAWGLSFLMPGVGQFYNGDVGKGIVFLGTYVAGQGFMLYGLTDPFRDYLVPIGLIIASSSWIWAQIDAPIITNRINRASDFASWNLGNGDAILSLQPDFNFTPISTGQKVALTPTYGVGLKIKF